VRQIGNKSKNNKMKTIIIISLAIMALNINVSFSLTGSDNFLNGPGYLNMVSLEPSVPQEADFSDVFPESTPAVCIAPPVAPKEATFEDEAFIPNSAASAMHVDLSPSVPAEAGFGEDEIPTSNGMSWIISTPLEAGFEDIL
jgi:hypothetical protein